MKYPWNLLFFRIKFFFLSHLFSFEHDDVSVDSVTSTLFVIFHENFFSSFCFNIKYRNLFSLFTITVHLSKKCFYQKTMLRELSSMEHIYYAIKINAMLAITKLFFFLV